MHTRPTITRNGPMWIGLKTGIYLFYAIAWLGVHPGFIVGAACAVVGVFGLLFLKRGKRE